MNEFGLFLFQNKRIRHLLPCFDRGMWLWNQPVETICQSDFMVPPGAVRATHPTEMMGLNFLSSAKMVWGYFGLRRQHLAWAREYTRILEPSIRLQVLTKTGSQVNMFQELWVSRLGGQDHPDSAWAVWPSLELPRTSNVINRSWPKIGQKHRLGGHWSELGSLRLARTFTFWDHYHTLPFDQSNNCAN